MSCNACVPPGGYYTTSPTPAPMYSASPASAPWGSPQGQVAYARPSVSPPAQQVSPRSVPYGPWAASPRQVAQVPNCGGCAPAPCAPPQPQYTACCPPPPQYEHGCRTVHLLPQRVNYAPPVKRVSFEHNTHVWGSACPTRPSPCQPFCG